MKYMLMMTTTAQSWSSFGAMTTEEVRAHIQFMKDINVELARTKELVDARGLTMPNETKVVRAGAGGAPIVTDGPFPETKEFLAGFWILDVKSPERVYEIAAKISTAPGRGGAPMNFPVEIRPVGSAPEV
ncbi:MAG: hypothetical protein JNK82_09635 [Myxococcaceae bacterium]|nr:hypothetical protein [Myxococcaceae bacterium]